MLQHRGSLYVIKTTCASWQAMCIPLAANTDLHMLPFS
jgi:hypothetical protein